MIQIYLNFKIILNKNHNKKKQKKNELVLQAFLQPDIREAFLSLGSLPLNDS